ncbi:hypothetical protein [Microbacterium sp. zg-YB36]|uniref:hypothetical protein n=1 Tax=Microbacterium sp. zg-YB36 TaxID=2969407 RepID=UPI00214B5FE1|nr:hypothetical protein [Microbacterium sp. zg-YB36]MDL5350701.1 hypothetical protein [Microbacterium sp. zg-YB36]
MPETDPSDLARLERLLFEEDPVGINLGFNTDEYRSEARTITARRGEARSVEDVLTIVHEECCHWFGTDTAGPRETYRPIAERVWEIWHPQD